MQPLALTLVTTALAPLADRLLRPRPGLEAFVDGVLRVVIAGLLLLEVVPEGLRVAGAPAGVALLAGIALGWWSHRAERSLAALAVVGLLLHGVTDGAALAAPDAPLAVAVVLHTLPVTLAVWRLASARGGRKLGVGLLVATAAATVAGFSGGSSLDGGATFWAIAQCGLAGALLHVLGHLAPPREGWAGGVGGLVGAALVVPEAVPELRAALVGSWLAWAPSLLLGYVAAGLLHALTPNPPATFLSGAAGPARGALLGVVVPVWCCRSVPSYRALLARGTPPGAGLAFLTSGRQAGVTAVLGGLPWLGLPLTLARIVGALCTAGVVGTLVGRSAGPGRPTAEAWPPTPDRARAGLRFASVEAVDHTAAWVLAGLLGAALLGPATSGVHLPVSVPPWLQVSLAAALGVPVYVCAVGVAPLVGAALALGVSPGAGLTFLLTGPAAHLDTLASVRRLHGPRVAAAFALGVVGVAVAAGLSVDALGWSAAGPVGDPGALEVASAVVLAALFAASLVRLGPTGFVDPLLHPTHDPGAHPSHPRSHVHGPGCGHDHRGPLLDLRGRVQLDVSRPPPGKASSGPGGGR